jgi:hypothetical protein
LMPLPYRIVKRIGIGGFGLAPSSAGTSVSRPIFAARRSDADGECD